MTNDDIIESEWDDPKELEWDDPYWKKLPAKKGKGRPRLPWKRGPVAWKIESDADEIKIRISAEKRKFFSLRKTARLLNVSTQPVRDWIRLGYLKRDGPRGQIAASELVRFVGWLEERAERFDPRNYLERFPPMWQFKKLGRLQWEWPKDRKALHPRELAKLAGCHPSLILKAIHSGFLRARHRTPCRFEITRQNWLKAYFGNNIPVTTKG
jgi:hypothetical protein